MKTTAAHVAPKDWPTDTEMLEYLLNRVLEDEREDPDDEAEEMFGPSAALPLRQKIANLMRTRQRAN